MTQNGVALSNTPSTVDFTSVATSTYGTNARKSMAGAFPAQALWAGDVTFNGQVKYTGGGNDRDPVLTTVGSATPGNTVNAYSTRDVNLNGQVKYTGSSNDRDPILLNVGSATPNNVRSNNCRRGRPRLIRSRSHSTDPMSISTTTPFYRHIQQELDSIREAGSSSASASSPVSRVPRSW